MKTKLYILIFTLIAPLLLASQVYYDRTYDIGFNDHPVAFVSDAIGNTYVCGWFEDANFENQRAFVFKVNIDGSEEWRVTLEEPSKYMALCITEGGNIALAGSRNNHSFLNLLDKDSGSEIWSYQQVSSPGYWFGSVNEITDGTEYRLHAAKTTDAKHKITYYVFDPDSGNFIKSVSDINYIYNPVFTSSQIASDRIWFANEELIIFNNMDGYCGMWYFNILHIAGLDKYSPTQGCVVRLFYWPGDGKYYIGVLTMTNEDPTVYGNAWEVIYQNYAVTGSGILDNGKLLVTGTIEGELALWFIDHELTTMTDRNYPSVNPRVGIDVLGLPTNDMVIMGTETGSTKNATDVFLMKLNEEGLVSTEELTHLDDNIQIFPNPTSGEIFVKSSTNKNVEIKIMNGLGQLVKKISTINQSTSINELPKGMYIASIYVDGLLVSQEKLIKK